MLIFNKVIFFFFLFLNLSSFAGSKIVYGEDDRLDFYQASKIFQKLSLSVGGIFSKHNSIEVDGNRTLLEPKTLGNKMNLCKGEKFAKQVSPLHCSFFLVSKDLVVTAAHCMKEENACENSKFLFDYKVTAATKKADILIENKNIYSCKKIESIEYKSLEGQPSIDYALVRLDRVVSDREPLRYRYQGFNRKEIPLFGSLPKGSSVSVVGHPSGLPLKFVLNSKITHTPNKHYFVADLDTFGGNSGSPVFDNKTHEVVGILVRGQKDYVFDKLNKCTRVNKLKSVSDLPATRRNRGESVSNIYQIKDLYK